jgi:hypothetical protein
MVTKDWFEALPQTVQKHLVCRSADERAPVTQKHDIESLVMGAGPV